MKYIFTMKKIILSLMIFVNLLKSQDINLEGEIYVDSSAALGVVARKGAGKLRHVRVGQLWVQEKSENGELRYRKVKGTENPADVLTKSLTMSKIPKLVVGKHVLCKLLITKLIILAKMISLN